MYINMGVNNGSEKLTEKTIASSGTLIKAVYGLYICVYLLCASQSGRLEQNTVVVGEMVRGEGAWVFVYVFLLIIQLAVLDI